MATPSSAGPVQAGMPAGRSAGGVGPLSFRRPPRLGFHLLLAITASPLILAASSPVGGRFLLSLASAVALLAASVLWAVWGLRWLLARRTHDATGSLWWFAVAPVLGTVFVGAFLLDVPLRTRWLVAREPFDQIVESAPSSSTPDPLELDVPAVVGTYRVEHAMRAGDSVFVFLEPGSSRRAFLVAAGFAHLPDGPPPRIGVLADDLGGERVEYHRLDGDWYTWASYW